MSNELVLIVSLVCIYAAVVLFYKFFGKTGLYEGEGSIVYAYLCLYKRSNEQIYLQYAEKHAQIVRKLLKQDQRYDVLSGNAGTAWSFVFQNSML